MIAVEEIKLKYPGADTVSIQLNHRINTPAIAKRFPLPLVRHYSPLSHIVSHVSKRVDFQC